MLQFLNENLRRGRQIFSFGAHHADGSGWLRRSKFNQARILFFMHLAMAGHFRQERHTGSRGHYGHQCIKLPSLENNMGIQLRALADLQRLKT